MKFFPVFNALCAAASTTPEKVAEGKEVVVPAALFVALVRTALSSVDIDTECYARQNQDLSDAFGSDAAKLKQHFVTQGYFEGRAFPFKGFDERYYQRKNPDVALACARGVIPNSFEHFQAEGMTELRSASAESEAEVAAWRDALSRVSPAKKTSRA